MLRTDHEKYLAIGGGIMGDDYLHPLDPEVIFQIYDHGNILDWIKDKQMFEGFRTARAFSDDPYFWDDTISLLENKINEEVTKYELRYRVKFEEAGSLLPDLEGLSKKPGPRTRNIYKLFK